MKHFIKRQCCRGSMILTVQYYISPLCLVVWKLLCLFRLFTLKTTLNSCYCKRCFINAQIQCNKAFIQCTKYGSSVIVPCLPLRSNLAACFFLLGCLMAGLNRVECLALEETDARPCICFILKSLFIFVNIKSVSSGSVHSSTCELHQKVGKQAIVNMLNNHFTSSS